MAQNKAAYLDAVGKPLRIGDRPVPEIAPGFIITRNHAVAVNPVDWKIQSEDAPWITAWPFVLGHDIAGEVVEVGEGVTHVKKGDRVVGHGTCLTTMDIQQGGFANYSRLDAELVSKLPDSISYPQASVLPLALDTAAVALYLSDKGHLGLPLPSLNPSPIGKVIVVWGGSSSVGALTIQLAVASGVKVITTASAHNFELVKKWGASEVFDHRSPTVDEDVVKAVRSSNETYAGFVDAIAAFGSFDHAFNIVPQLGCNKLALVGYVSGGAPDGIELGFVIARSPVTHAIWRNYVTPALENGELKCVPEPMVVGKGLESVQLGMDTNKKGVSAKKVVIEL